MKPVYKKLKHKSRGLRWYLFFKDTYGNLYDSMHDFKTLNEAITKAKGGG